MSAIAQDPELTHLLELLRMLPGPRENPRFWDAVAEHASPASSVTYVFEKLSGIWRTAQEPTPHHVEHLARYLLYFFAGDNPELWKILNTVAHNRLAMPHDETGRWWAQDVSRTAWALYVRYNQAVTGQWTLKWQYRQAWDEWLPAAQPE